MGTDLVARGNARRARYARENGLDLIYAETSKESYRTWAYSDGRKVPMPTFFSLEGLQTYAQKRKFAIIYVL
jgi:hypothetical protein